MLQSFKRTGAKQTRNGHSVQFQGRTPPLFNTILLTVRSGTLPLS